MKRKEPAWRGSQDVATFLFSAFLTLPYSDFSSLYPFYLRIFPKTHYAAPSVLRILVSRATKVIMAQVVSMLRKLHGPFRIHESEEAKK